tara:strand:+ start:316 stop:537 length:222 start_codon:yes stop_codon:yes gene_type:complete
MEKANMNVNKHIIDQICEDFEYRTLVLEESELTAMKILCKEWSMTPMEMNDIVVAWKKKIDDIDETGDLGEFI